MKKIRCDVMEEDYLYVNSDRKYAYLHSVQGSRNTEIALSPAKIRKLRKQLKRALVEIEGEPKKADESELRARGRDLHEDEKIEYKPGDLVYLIEGNSEGKDWFTSPSAVDIDLAVPVELVTIKNGSRWILKYTTTCGEELIGYASEKSFGRRA